MATNMFDEHSFKDYYKAEDTDDEENNNDLLARLYSKIYYPSNNEIELGANILSNAVPLSDCIVNESIYQENIQNKLDDTAVSKLEVTRGQEESVAEVSVQISKNNLVNQATSSTIEGKKKKKSSSKKHKSQKQPKNRKGLQRRNIAVTVVDETDMDTKYNVLQKSMKQKQLMLKQQRETWEDSSDSESILEVPLPPKPKPLLINLQDSDDEDAGSSIDEDDLLEGRLHGKNVPKGDSDSEIVKIRDRSSSPEVEIVEVSYDRQDTVAKNKVIDKSPRTKNILATKSDKSTRVHVFNEDIVLNCTMIQKGARSINEIKQLSKSPKQNRTGTLIEDTIKCSKKRSLQDASRGNSSNDACTFQEPYWISPERGKETREQSKWMWQNVNTDKTNETRNFAHNLTRMQSMEDTLLEVSCGSNNNPVVNLEKRSEGNSGEARNNSPLRKRQCTVQQGDQSNVAPTPCSSGHRVKKSDSFWINYFFKPLPEEIKKFYNDSRGQENFNMHELQHDMSKDPNMWAILDEDLMPSPAIKRHRYWSKFTRCSNCQRDSHTVKDCPHPHKGRCCYMCGEQGHEIWSCPKKQCLNCGQKQTSYIKTCEHCRTLYCTMCRSTGHKKESCPDLWRRYHQVTKLGDGVPWSLGNMMKPASQLYCCNCSKRGHESSTCKEYRWSLHFPTPAFVTNYTDGPMYELEVSSEKILTNTKTANASLLRTRSNMMLNQQMQKNIPVMRTQAGPSLNVDASSSSANAKTYERANTQENTEEQVMPISKATVLQFTNVIYCYGNFRQKNNRDAWVLVSNLSQHKALSSSGKLFLQDRFMNGTIIPVFLKKLRKIAEFKMTIGPLVADPEVTVQLMAPKECVYLLFYLLLYWLNLPLSEKQQGINVDLPTNTGEMYNFLINLKMPRLNKNLQNPLEFINAINDYKNKLHNMPKDDNYFRNQMHMQSIQTKLLAYIHTHPERSEHFRKISFYRNKLKYRVMSKQLDAATYFDILLSYNNMYTPHTPPNLRVTLYNILRHQKKQNLKKKSNLTPEQLPSNADLLVPFMTSSSQMPQEIDTVVNSFATADIHDASDVFEVENVDNIYQPATSDLIENLMQCPQHISSFDSEPISINNERYLSRKMKKKLKLENEMRFKQVLYKKARQIADRAFAFKSSHMIQAAENLEKNIKNKTLKSKHIKALRKMIDLEKKHQKHIKMYYNHLN